MKLLLLYPAAWRRRYGEELETLMRESGTGWRNGIDVLKGAIQMRLKLQPAGIAAALILAGTLAGALTAYLRPQLWEAASVVQLIRFNPTDDGAAMQNLVRSSVSAIEGPRLRISAQPRLEQGKQVMLFSLTATARDPQKAMSAADDAARRLANRVGLGFRVRLKLLRKPIPQRIRDEDRLVAPVNDYEAFLPVHPSLAAMPVSPGPWTYISLGFAAGSILALVVLLRGHRASYDGLLRA